MKSMRKLFVLAGLILACVTVSCGKDPIEDLPVVQPPVVIVEPSPTTTTTGTTTGTTTDTTTGTTDDSPVEQSEWILDNDSILDGVYELVNGSEVKDGDTLDLGWKTNLLFKFIPVQQWRDQPYSRVVQTSWDEYYGETIYTVSHVAWRWDGAPDDMKAYSHIDDNHIVLSFTADVGDEIRHIVAKYKFYAEDFIKFSEINNRFESKFKSEGNGFYSHSHYHIDDWNDPEQLFEAFKIDAARFGRDDLAEMEWSDIEFMLDYDEKYFAPNGSPVCRGHHDKPRIIYPHEDWLGSAVGTPQKNKLQTFYHELGHAILGYAHPKDDNGSVIEGYGGDISIMGYNNAKYDNGDKRSWNEMLEVFFEEELQDYMCEN